MLAHFLARDSSHDPKLYTFFLGAHKKNGIFLGVAGNNPMKGKNNLKINKAIIVGTLLAAVPGWAMDIKSRDLNYDYDGIANGVEQSWYITCDDCSDDSVHAPKMPLNTSFEQNKPFHLVASEPTDMDRQNGLIKEPIAAVSSGAKLISHWFLLAYNLYEHSFYLTFNLLDCLTVCLIDCFFAPLLVHSLHNEHPISGRQQLNSHSIAPMISFCSLSGISMWMLTQQ